MLAVILHSTGATSLHVMMLTNRRLLLLLADMPRVAMEDSMQLNAVAGRAVTAVGVEVHDRDRMMYIPTGKDPRVRRATIALLDEANITKVAERPYSPPDTR